MGDFRIFIDAAKEFGLFKTIFLFILFTIVTSGGSFWYGGKKAQVDIGVQTEQTATTNINVASATGLTGSDFKQGGDMCSEKKFESNTPDWLFNEYNDPDDGGFYCVRKRSNFSSPEIWNRNTIPANFKSVQITFEIKNEDIANEDPPSFIFSLGQIPRLFRFYVPETLPQVIGFEKIDLNATSSKQGLIRTEPKELKDPIKDNTQTELTVRPFIIKDNKAKYIFDVKYISAQTGNTEEETFEYDVKLPFPDASSAVDFGIGTFEGSCIKPVRYKICI